MKKFTFLCLAGLLILAVSSAYARDKFEMKISGFIDAQSLWMLNVTGGNRATGVYNAVDANYMPVNWTATQIGYPYNYVTAPPAARAPIHNGFNKSEALMESRTRLKFDAVMGKSLSGTIFFEMDSQPWGNPPGGNAGLVTERNSYGYWSGDRAAVEIKDIYIDWGVPGIPVPMTVRVGLQPLAIRPNLLLTTDGMAVTAGIKIDPVMIMPMWAKAVEGRNWNADDVDVYGLNVNAKLGTFTVGGYGLYYNMNSYPLFNPAPTWGSYQASMWWLGLYADGKAGPVDLNFDFIYDTGKVMRPGTETIAFPKVKYSGWATRLKIDFPWEKFNFGAVGHYASGADREKTSSTGLPGTATDTGVASSKVGSYVVPPGSEAGTNYGESLVIYNSWINRGDSGVGTSLNYNSMSRGPIGGTWMAKAYASVKATPWYKATFQVLYIGDTTQHGNTFGTAYASPFPVPGMAIRRDDSSIGWEFDLIHEIQIYKNLKYAIGMGYLFAGKAMDYGYIGPGGLQYNVSPKNPWNITTNLTYNF